MMGHRLSPRVSVKLCAVAALAALALPAPTPAEDLAPSIALPGPCAQPSRDLRTNPVGAGAAKAASPAGTAVQMFSDDSGPVTDLDLFDGMTVGVPKVGSVSGLPIPSDIDPTVGAVLGAALDADPVGAGLGDPLLDGDGAGIGGGFGGVPGSIGDPIADPPTDPVLDVDVPLPNPIDDLDVDLDDPFPGLEKSP